MSRQIAEKLLVRVRTMKQNHPKDRFIYSHFLRQTRIIRALYTNQISDLIEFIEDIAKELFEQNILN
jgi:hypothetical protein